MIEEDKMPELSLIVKIWLKVGVSGFLLTFGAALYGVVCDPDAKINRVLNVLCAVGIALMALSVIIGVWLLY